MKFVSETEPQNLSVSYLIVDDQDNILGSAEGYTSKNGELLSVIKIKSDQQKKGLGFTAFKKVYDELNISVEIRVIIGSWHSGGEFQDFEDGMSTNLKCFFEAYESGKTEEESAFETPTGKWAKKLGYSNCQIGSISRTEGTVKFFKHIGNN